MTRILTLIGSFLFSVHILALQPPGGQGEFEQISQLPATEQLPAAPLLIAAYAFAWVAVFFYVWTLWRRLAKVEGEMHALEQRQARRGQTR